MVLLHFMYKFVRIWVVPMCCLISFSEAAHPAFSISQSWEDDIQSEALDRATQIDSQLNGVDRGFVGEAGSQQVVAEQLPMALRTDALKSSFSSKYVSFKAQPKPARSSLIEVDGVPVYSQNKQDPYDRDGYRGRYPRGYCGPTVMQMLLDFYGLKLSRDYLALTDLGTGPMYRRGQGSRYAPMVEMARHLGFSATEIVFTNNLKQLENRLRENRPQIVSLKGYLKYVAGAVSRNTQGHIVLITGIDEKNRLIIHDPAGRGSRAIMNAKDFRRVWRGFFVDIRGEGGAVHPADGKLMLSKDTSDNKDLVKQQNL